MAIYLVTLILLVFPVFAGIKGSFIIGIGAGKVFLLTENLWFPIVLHLAVNLTVLEYATRRIINLKEEI